MKTISFTAEDLAKIDWSEVRSLMNRNPIYPPNMTISANHYKSILLAQGWLEKKAEEYICQLQSQDYCPCGGIILADTEDWEIPLCYECFIEQGGNP